MDVAVRDRVVEAAGRRIPIRDWGDPAAPPLVLLHGLFGNSHEWTSVARRLAARRRVLVPDQRGHGGADWATDYTATAFVADLANLVDALDLDTVDLVGHSMGGIVSMLYAGHHPDRVRDLVVVDIGPETFADRGAVDGFGQMLAQLSGSVYDGAEAVVAQWCEGDPLARPAETLDWARHALRRRPDGRWVWRVDIDHIGQFLTEAPTVRELWSAVERIEAPTLVIHGEHSWALPGDAASVLAARLRRGRAVRVDGAGHDLGVQAPEAVAAHVADFLDHAGAALG